MELMDVDVTGIRATVRELMVQVIRVRGIETHPDPSVS